MRKLAKERAIRSLGPRSEDIKEEEKKKKSDGSSEMHDAQMSGVTQREAETDVASEESSEDEWISEKKEKKKRKVISDAERRLGFGPYAAFTYEEVLMSKPEYFKFLIE